MYLCPECGEIRGRHLSRCKTGARLSAFYREAPRSFTPSWGWTEGAWDLSVQLSLPEALTTQQSQRLERARFYALRCPV